MSAVAMGLLKKGYSVSGSDLIKNNETNKLFFSSKGKHIEVGNFLNQEQKEDLIKEIRSAISFLNSLDP